MSHRIKLCVFCVIAFFQTVSFASEALYTVNPGDVLGISVWKEEELSREIHVLPDGHISFPLAGDMKASGLTIPQIKEKLVAKLSEFISDPVVNIRVNAVEGNLVYAIGQVKTPGRFIMHTPLDVMQVLSLAGGLTAFAKSNDIVILRRNAKGSKAIKIRYGDLEDGNDLKKNILLKSGDVVVVP